MCLTLCVCMCACKATGVGARHPCTVVLTVHCTTPGGAIQKAGNVNDAAWNGTAWWEDACQEMNVQVGASVLGGAHTHGWRFVWDHVSLRAIVSLRVCVEHLRM